jgi:hypothetical protein
MTIARDAFITALALPVSVGLTARDARAQGVPMLSGDLVRRAARVVPSAHVGARLSW